MSRGGAMFEVRYRFGYDPQRTERVVLIPHESASEAIQVWLDKWPDADILTVRRLPKMSEAT